MDAAPPPASVFTERIAQLEAIARPETASLIASGAAKLELAVGNCSARLLWAINRRVRAMVAISRDGVLCCEQTFDDSHKGTKNVSSDCRIEVNSSFGVILTKTFLFPFLADVLKAEISKKKSG
jgi:hypothetical protein